MTLGPSEEIVYRSLMQDDYGSMSGASHGCYDLHAALCKVSFTAHPSGCKAQSSCEVFKCVSRRMHSGFCVCSAIFICFFSFVLSGADLHLMGSDAQVETPLELASGLSLSLDNRLFLKREDLQPVSLFKAVNLLHCIYNKIQCFVVSSTEP